MLETQLKRNRRRNPSFYHSLSYPFSRTPLCGHNSCHLPILYTSKHDHVILLYLHTLPLSIIPQTPNQLSSTLNIV